jgi:hypothetical protein
VFSARQRTAIHWLRKSGEPNGGKLAGVTILEADRTSVAGLAKKCEGDNRKHGYDYDCTTIAIFMVSWLGRMA